MSTQAQPPDPKNNRMPISAAYIVGNEAAERFSYYGIRSILAGYITGEVVRGGLGQSADTSTSIIHLFIFANYFMPLVGAWMSDRLIGRYNTILYVSLIYSAGNGVLACSDLFTTVSSKMICLAVGLGLIAFGSGGIKPCVSAFMGDQFRPEQGHLLQKAYGAFYWAINFGSFFSFLVVPWVKDQRGYGWAFGVPGMLMALATLIFWLGTKHYTRIPPARQTNTAGFLKVFVAAIRNQSRMTLTPLINILASLVLPAITLIALTMVALMPSSSSFSDKDLKDPARFAARLVQPADAVSTYLNSKLSDNTKEELAKAPGATSASASVKAAVLGDLNRCLTNSSLYDPQRFQGVTLRPETARLLARKPQGEDGIWLNRMLLEDAYPSDLARRPMGTVKLARTIGWTALAGVGVWYLLIVAMSLAGRLELPDSFWQAARRIHCEADVSAARSVGPILFVFALVPVFWALFDQTTSTWVLQGNKMTAHELGGAYVVWALIVLVIGLIAAGTMGRRNVARWTGIAVAGVGFLASVLMLTVPQQQVTEPGGRTNVLILTGVIVVTAAMVLIGLTKRPIAHRAVVILQGLGILGALGVPGIPSALTDFRFTIGAEQMQSANPALVMILVPLLTLGLYPRLGRLATPLRRMSAGMFFGAASYVIVAWLQQRVQSGEQVSVLWQTVPYLVLTAGEVLLSTTGLEFAFAESAPTMRSTIMSFWLLTVAFGNLLVTGITKVLGAGAEDSSVTATRFLLYAGLTAVVGVLFSLVAMRYRYRHPSFKALAGEN